MRNQKHQREYADPRGYVERRDIWHLTNDGRSTLCHHLSEQRIHVEYAERELDGQWCAECQAILLGTMRP